MIQWRWFFCAALIAGCAAKAGHQPDVSAKEDESPTTAPSANGPSAIKWTTLKLEDFKPLARLEEGGESTQLGYKHRPAGAQHTLYFGELTNSDEQMIPIIAERVGGTYKAVKVASEWAYDQWVSIQAGPKPNELWCVLDQVNDTQQEDDDRQTSEITVFHSTDAGKTFQTGVLHKPCRKASFADLLMSRSGRGRITLALNEVCGKFKPGLYHYRTTDGGKTFSPPEHEPDATKPADEVPEDEQPNQGNQSASIHP